MRVSVASPFGVPGLIANWTWCLIEVSEYGLCVGIVKNYFGTGGRIRTHYITGLEPVALPVALLPQK